MSKVLLKQLSHAVPEIYLKCFKDPNSNAFNATIQTILEYLFTTYGKITDDELREKEVNLSAQVFDITQPMIQLYDAVKNLQQIAKASLNDYTNAQILSIGITLIKNMNYFERGLTDWFVKPKADNTWMNFKAHFEKEYNALKKIRGITMKSTISQQQANAVSHDIRQEMRDENNTLRAEVAATEQKLFAAMEFFEQRNMPSDQNSAPTDIDTQHSEKDPVHTQLLQMISDLNNNRDTVITTNSYKDINGSKRPTKKGKMKYTCPDTTKYCWSHGACGHDFKDCLRKIRDTRIPQLLRTG